MGLPLHMIFTTYVPLSTVAGNVVDIIIHEARGAGGRGRGRGEGQELLGGMDVAFCDGDV